MKKHNLSTVCSCITKRMTVNYELEKQVQQRVSDVIWAELSVSVWGRVVNPVVSNIRSDLPISAATIKVNAVCLPPRKMKNV